MRAYTTVRAGGSKKAMLPLCFNIQTPTAQITTFSPLTMDLLVQNVPYSPNIMFGVLFIITRHLSVIMSLRGWLYVTIVSCQKTVVYWSVGYGSSARRLNEYSTNGMICVGVFFLDFESFEPCSI